LISDRMARVGALAVIGTATLLASSCVTVSTSSPTTEVVVIAADLELSGDGAALGAVYRNALELRVDQVNDQRLLGNRRLELRILDNRTDRVTSAANIAELASDDSVTAIIAGGCAECLLAAVDSVNSSGVPTISLAADAGIADPVAERRYVFKLGPNPADTASALVAEMNRSGVRTIALVTSDDEYGEDGRREIVGTAGAAGAAARADIEVAIDGVISAAEDGQDDQQALVEQIIAFVPEPVDAPGQPGPGEEEEPMAGPDAVVLWTGPSLAGEFAVELRGSGYAGPLFLDSTAADSLFLTGASGAALAGATMIFTETLVIDEVIATSPAKTARKTWFNEYSARYGTYHAFASFAADAVLLIVEAINRLDSTDRDAIRDALELMQLDGLSGPLRITPDNHSGLTPIALTTLVAQGERWRLAG
jgi:branched-chain amino acid transport system substrate-binding protein